MAYHEVVQLAQQHTLIGSLDLQTSILTLDVRNVVRHELRAGEAEAKDQLRPTRGRRM